MYTFFWVSPQTIEKFLSCDVNYVISSFCPVNMRQEERPSTGEDNPQSPGFVPSPFSCGPSPTATSSDPKKNLVCNLFLSWVIT